MKKENIKYEKNHGGRENYFPTKYQKDLTGDCVIRSIAIASGLDYMKVFSDLCDLAKETGFLPNFPETYEKYIESIGFIKHKPLKNQKGKKYEVRHFPIEPGKSYIIKTRSHLTAIKGGIHYDTWWCGESCANSYWTK